MEPDDDLTTAAAAAIGAAPVSRRELARRAGRSHATLNRIAGGDGRATPDAARAVADALDAVAREAAEARDRVLAALDRAGGR